MCVLSNEFPKLCDYFGLRTDSLNVLCIVWDVVDSHIATDMLQFATEYQCVHSWCNIFLPKYVYLWCFTLGRSSVVPRNAVHNVNTSVCIKSGVFFIRTANELFTCVYLMKIRSSLLQRDSWLYDRWTWFSTGNVILKTFHCHTFTGKHIIFNGKMCCASLLSKFEKPVIYFDFHSLLKVLLLWPNRVICTTCRLHFYIDNG